MSRRLSQLRNSETPASGSRSPAIASSSRRLSVSNSQNYVSPATNTRTRTAARAATDKDSLESTKKSKKTLPGALSRLVAGLKKRDNYAFFLQPVNTREVPGYLDVIKHPMDLGTMSLKVDRDLYASIDEFKDDFLLVTNNAKTFNPPETIFHSEAAKLEKWGLDAIAKATQKLVEAEQAAEALAAAQAEARAALVALGQEDEYIKVEDDGEDASRMSVDRVTRSLSAAPMPARMGKRRGGYRPRGAPKSLDELWKIPGPESGIGQFPYGSDLAGIMLELELMGKKVLTKKERQRLERQALKMPIAPDGSVDFSEMEDPFSVLSTFLPPPVTAPELEVVPPSASSHVKLPRAARDAYSSVYPTVSVPPTNISARSSENDDPPSSAEVHWSVQRAGSAGFRRMQQAEEDEARKKDLEREGVKEPVLRDPAPVDWGSFATLPMKWNVGDSMWYTDEAKIQGKIRDDIRKTAERLKHGGKKSMSAEELEAADKLGERAAFAGEAWLRDVVYGGVDGVAYVKSVGSFVGKALKYAKANADPPSPIQEGAKLEEDIKLEEDVDMEPSSSESRPLKRKREEEIVPGRLLPLPLADFVSNIVIDPLTSGLHEILDRIGEALDAPSLPIPQHLPNLGNHIRTSFEIVPQAQQKLAELKRISRGPLDMGTVLRAPEEFFYKDNEWTERGTKRTKRSPEVMSPTTNGNASRAATARSDAYINFGLAKATDTILRMSKEVEASIRMGQSGETAPTPAAGAVKPANTRQTAKAEEATEDEEDPEFRKLRLNLLTMTRHVPLAELAPLEPELIPEHVRHLFPSRINTSKTA